MNRRLLEKLDIQPVMAPVDLNAAAITGDYVSMKNHKSCAIVVCCGDGTANFDLSVTLYQAQDVSGTGAKVLPVLETGRIYTKEHASVFSSIGTWTEETQATASETFTTTDSGEQANLWVLDVFESDLDGDNNFDCIRADIADPGAAKIGAAFYVLHDPKYVASPDLIQSPIVD